jgi:hypothetical protein
MGHGIDISFNGTVPRDFTEWKSAIDISLESVVSFNLMGQRLEIVQHKFDFRKRTLTANGGKR